MARLRGRGRWHGRLRGRGCWHGHAARAWLLAWQAARAWPLASARRPAVAACAGKRERRPRRQRGRPCMPLTPLAALAPCAVRTPAGCDRGAADGQASRAWPLVWHAVRDLRGPFGNRRGPVRDLRDERPASTRMDGCRVGWTPAGAGAGARAGCGAQDREKPGARRLLEPPERLWGNSGGLLEPPERVWGKSTPLLEPPERLWGKSTPLLEPPERLWQLHGAFETLPDASGGTRRGVFG